jgi:hypothetical protein
MNHILNKNRYLCLFISLFIGIMAWYNLILFTTNEYLPMPTSDQFNGLYISVFLSVIYWVRQVYTIKLN